MSRAAVALTAATELPTPTPPPRGRPQIPPLAAGRGHPPWKGDGHDHPNGLVGDPPVRDRHLATRAHPDRHRDDRRRLARLAPDTDRHPRRPGGDNTGPRQAPAHRGCRVPRPPGDHRQPPHTAADPRRACPRSPRRHACGGHPAGLPAARGPPDPNGPPGPASAPGPSTPPTAPSWTSGSPATRSLSARSCWFVRRRQAVKSAPSRPVWWPPPDATPNGRAYAGRSNLRASVASGRARNRGRAKGVVEAAERLLEPRRVRNPSSSRAPIRRNWFADVRICAQVKTRIQFRSRPFAQPPHACCNSGSNCLRLRIWLCTAKI